MGGNRENLAADTEGGKRFVSFITPHQLNQIQADSMIKGLFGVKTPPANRHNYALDKESGEPVSLLRLVFAIKLAEVTRAKMKKAGIEFVEGDENRWKSLIQMGEPQLTVKTEPEPTLEKPQQYEYLEFRGPVAPRLALVFLTEILKDADGNPIAVDKKSFKLENVCGETKVVGYSLGGKTLSEKAIEMLEKKKVTLTPVKA
jgi:hypothetical protein